MPYGFIAVNFNCLKKVVLPSKNVGHITLTLEESTQRILYYNQQISCSI